MEKAIAKYRLTLKEFFLSNSTSKEYDKLYYKLVGMESILEAVGINADKIRNEVASSVNL
jgi:hypothetical protein